MQSLLDYLDTLADEQRLLVIALHDHIVEVDPPIEVRMAYGIPFFYKGKRFAYLNPLKNGDVDLGFTRGHAMKDFSGLLEEKGRAQIKTATFQTVEEVPWDTVTDWVQQAILLNEQLKGERRQR